MFHAAVQPGKEAAAVGFEAVGIRGCYINHIPSNCDHHDFVQTIYLIIMVIYQLSILFFIYLALVDLL